MKLIKVPYIDQSVKYPTGCESVSSVMLLRYLGYNLSVDEFIEKYLDCRDREVRNGIMYGPDPNVSFCGSPYREEYFGCYAPVIHRALERAAGEKYRFINETGTSIEDLLTNYIDKNMPVVFWACINMQKEIPGPGWKL